MKKLLIIVAIAISAACANASMVYWSFTNSAINNSSKNPPWTYFDTAQNLNGMTAYLISASDWDTSDVAASLGKAQDSRASSTWSKTTWNETAGQAVFQTGKLTAENLSLAVGTGDFYVVLADDSKYWASDKLTGVSILEDGSIATTYTAAAVTLSAATALTPASFTAVPEPTSGLLMMLGLAGLVLRRKRA